MRREYSQIGGLSPLADGSDLPILDQEWRKEMALRERVKR